MSKITAGVTTPTALTLTGDTTGGITFEVSGTVTAATIDSSGNVGIGTTTAAAGGLLTLNKAPAAAFGSPLLQVGGASFTSGGYYSIGLGFTDATYTEPPGEIAFVTTSDSGGTLGSIVFGTRSVTTNTAVSERMRIDSSGNVGIGGTAGAGAKVHALGTYPTSGGETRVFQANGTIPSGTTTAASIFRSEPAIENASFTLGNLYGFWAGQGTKGASATITNQYGFFVSSGLSDATNNYGFYSNLASGGNRWNFYAAGTAKNYFAGETLVGGTTDQGAYNLQCNGTGVWGAGAYVNGSDARIKEDVNPIASGLDVVEKLNPVTYRYKEEWSKDQSVQTGFIAQELLTALDGQVYADGVVQQGGSEGYYSVAYQNIIPILTKAIQELKAENDALKARLDALEAQ